MKTLLHVNYHEGAGKLDELFQIANRFGYDGVELRWRYKFPDFTQASYQEHVAALKDKYPEMEIVFGGCINYCRGSQDEVQKDQDEYFQFLEWAEKACGTKVMNFFTGNLIAPGRAYTEYDKNGSGMATEEDYQKSAAGLRLVGDEAVKHGMLIALETHNCYLHDLAKSCRKLFDLCGHPAIGANYDQGNIILNKNGEKIDQIFQLIPDKIHYAHLKNMYLVSAGAGGFLCTRLSDGHINTMQVMEGLKKYLKSGIFAVEYPNTGDGVWAACKDMEYIRFLKDYLDIQ